VHDTFFKKNRNSSLEVCEIMGYFENLNNQSWQAYGGASPTSAISLKFIIGANK
jgi:hypothetical protein